MDSVSKLEVFYHDRLVGTMAIYDRQRVAFEYSEDWINDGFSISPFSLPLKKEIYISKVDPFNGLFGVFNDSLPDGWGRLLVDRLMKKNGINPHSVNELTRLAIVGNSGMGALTYRPAVNLSNEYSELSLDQISEECAKIINTKSVDNIDYLFEKGGSSGGARPKILTKVDDEDWIIKFATSYDSNDIGKQEYEYSLCARECGIEISETRLFDSKKCNGYFGTKRFDRRGNQETDKIHMISASGLLETSHRVPNLDYDLLMRLTLEITKSMEECEKLYRYMCFNVFSHNRDDHSKNFSYLYNEEEERWKLSPAYDLTYSNSIGGEHATTVAGNGANPGINDILTVAKNIGISSQTARKIAMEIKACVHESLSKYLS